MRSCLIVHGVCCVALLAVAGFGAFGCNKQAEEAPPPATQAAFVNARCPIMGTPIDPAKVPAELTRTYKGQQVAFCCAGCPTEWDELSDEEKDAKLAAAMPASGQPTAPEPGRDQ